VKIANAPLSYGAFEMTVGTEFAVPDPAWVVEAMRLAGYAGTELGPPGYLDPLHLGGLELVGGFIQIPFSDQDASHRELHATLDALGDVKHARPVLCDAGGPERIANPGRGGEDPSLPLDEARWRTLIDGVERAADATRERGFEPVFHHHTSTYVESVEEIERFLEYTDIPLLLDCAHLVVAGGDPLQALRDWGERIEAIHIKDVRLDVLAAVKAARADTLTAWRSGLFCALGQGHVDLAGFCRGVEELGYDGWIVVEQDRVLKGTADLEAAAADQVANRAWLREHCGW
jgi:inosose dehydratase